MKRDDFTLPLAFPGELIIDNFAGGGGTSTGLEAAFGRPVDIAINHDSEALAMHAMNHPHTLHLCESVWSVDPIKVTGNQPVALVWLSPDCKHFSKAKGGTPVAKHIRGLAWVGMRWVALCKPRVLMLENVEEFKTWGPVVVGTDGHARPCPVRRGKTFESFVRQLRQHGYTVDWRELRASDYGTPTIRKRLFLIARRDGLPITWPEQTHAEPTDRRVLAGKLAPHRTAAECIDWSIEGASIFGRARPLAVNTQRRVAKGLWRHVLASASPFIVSTTYHRHEQTPGSNVHQDRPIFRRRSGVDLQDRCHQDSTKGAHVLQPQRETGPHDQTGGAVSIRNRTRGRQLLGKLSDMPALHGQVHRGGLLVTIGYGERPGQDARTQPIEKPLGTAVAGGIKQGVVAATLVDMGHGEGSCGTKRWSHGVRDLRTPLGTCTASNPPSALVSAFMEQANGGFYDGDGRRADDPASTITSSGAQQRLVTAYAVKYYSNGGQWQAMGEPMHTLPTKARMGLVQAEQVPADTIAPEHRERARQCAELLHTHLPEHFAQPADLVLMHHAGQWWVLVDITLRMLKPRELYKAQGFPDHYVIDQIPDPKRLFADGHQAAHPLELPRTPLSTTAQVRMCGNSVCPPVAEALVRANFAHEALIYGRAVA